MFHRQTAPSLVLGLATLVSLVAGCGHVVGANALTSQSARLAAQSQVAATADDEIPSTVSNNSPIAPFRFQALHPTANGSVKPAVLSMPSPNQGERSVAIDTLIMHHTSSAADAQHIGSFFSQAASKVSAHYTVGKDGVIVQSVPDDAVSWHAGVSSFLGRKGVNAFSIGIEMCNLGDGQDPYTDEQYKALGKLVAYILVEHQIKWDHVTGHKDIALPKGRKDDPSPNFSYARMKQEVLAVAPNAGQ